MTTRSSFAVCQCHGTRQPDPSLRNTHAGPLRGLPRTIAPEAQLGISGMGSNLSDCGFTAAICPSSLACVAVDGTSAAAAAQTASSTCVRPQFIPLQSYLHLRGC